MTKMAFIAAALVAATAYASEASAPAAMPHRGRPSL
jgi:hypothetical protein